MLHIGPMLVDGQYLSALLNVSDRHRHIAPDIHANIYSISATYPLLMNVTEKVKRTFTGLVPSDHWIMAKNGRCASSIRYLSQVRDRGPGQGLGGFAIMISNYKVLFCAWQPRKKL